MCENVRPKPKVGDTLILVENYHRNSSPRIKEVTVDKVGRKYFKITGAGYRVTQFYIETWEEHTEYHSYCSLYASLEEYAAIVSVNSACGYVKHKVRDLGKGSITDEQWIEIAKILGWTSEKYKLTE